MNKCKISSRDSSFFSIFADSKARPYDNERLPETTKSKQINKDMNNHKMIFALVAMALMAVTTGCKDKDSSKEKLQYVKTVEAVSMNRVNSVNYPGRTKSTEDVNMAFRVSGPISQICVKEGDHVRKGQLIATMDSRDYQVQLNATKAEYEQIKADAERIIAMYQEGNTTASNYDKARYGLQQIEQKLSNHRNQLADTRLYAPTDGYIETILHEAGETVGAGMPVVSMFGSKAVEVEVNISAYDYANRERLNKVYCEFDLMPGERFPMQISSISPEANASQLYTIRLRFTGPYDRSKITPGMTTMVYVDIDTDSIGNNVIIPSTAIFEKQGQQHVFVFDKKTSTVSLRNVMVKKLHRDGVAEIESGLADGETVVSAGVHYISDGQKVAPLPPKSKSNVGGLL